MNKLTIPKRKYEGYVWYSDQPNPEVLYNEEYELNQDEGENPFVIEALLYCKDEELSLSVKHTGQYIINEHKLTDLEKDSEKVEKEYLAHRIKDVKKLKFYQYWQEEEDANCAEFKTLKLQTSIFVGFNSKND